jgi:hypothetical protein
VKKDQVYRAQVTAWPWVFWGCLPGILMFALAIAKYEGPWFRDLLSGNLTSPIPKDPLAEVLNLGVLSVLIGWVVWSGFIYLLWRATRHRREVGR